MVETPGGAVLQIHPKLNLHEILFNAFDDEMRFLHGIRDIF